MAPLDGGNCLLLCLSASVQKCRFLPKSRLLHLLPSFMCPITGQSIPALAPFIYILKVLSVSSLIIPGLCAHIRFDLSLTVNVGSKA